MNKTKISLRGASLDVSIAAIERSRDPDGDPSFSHGQSAPCATLILRLRRSFTRGSSAPSHAPAQIYSRDGQVGNEISVSTIELLESKWKTE